MDYWLIINIALLGLLCFVTVWFLSGWLIRFLKRIQLVVHDQNKAGKPLVPISGGLAVLGGVVVGFMVYVFYRTFFSYFTGCDALSYVEIMLLFAALLSLFIVVIIGFLDDLAINRDRLESGGLKQWQKPLLTLAAAIPLMVIGAGFSEMNIPFINITINFGLFYPLLLIPLAVVFSSNMVNMLAGINGMEAGMGLVYMGMLAVYAFVNNRILASLIAFLIFCSLLGYWKFNKYPAKILPGDSLTYLLGGGLAIVAIIGNIEKAVLIVSIPFIIEFFLKFRSGFQADSFGHFKDGAVCRIGDDKRIYSLTHLFLNKGKFSEKEIAYKFMMIELVFCLLMWVI